MVTPIRTRATFRRPNPTLLCLEPLEDRRMLSTCHVTRLGDLGHGKGLRGDLRYCLDKVDDLPGHDVVAFKVTGAINLSSTLPGLHTEVSIRGPGADVLTVDGNDNGRIFIVGAGGQAEISGLTITNGVIGFSGSSFGGGINNAGKLLLARCVISNNSAEVYGPYSYAYGGGIYNSGDLTVIESSFLRNVARTNQISYAYGGGIYNAGNLTVIGSTFYDNGAWQSDLGSDTLEEPYGGAIYNTGDVTMINSTLSANWAAYEIDIAHVAGIANHASGKLNISHSTIALNEIYGFGGTGTGIWSEGTLNVRNSIIARNKFHYFGYGSDVFGNLTNSSYNLFGAVQGSGVSETDIQNADPKLGPLQDNGGPTQTHALLPGSLALDAGNNHEPPEWDQRGPGFPRIVNGTIDIGAFEVQARGAPDGDIKAVLATADFDDNELLGQI